MKLKVAVVGAGYHSQIHVEALLALSNLVELVAVCDSDESRAKSLATRWNIPHAVSSLDQLIEEIQPDAAHVVVPPPAHAEVAIRLLQAKIHVLVEKPMATSLEDAQRMVAAADEAGVRLGVVHNQCTAPAFSRLCADVESGRFGRVHHAQLMFNVPLRQLATGDITNWMVAQPQNILLDLGYHAASNIHHLFGAARRVEVITGGRRELAPGQEFYDTWQLGMECERGTAQLFFSVGRDYTALTVDVIGQDGRATADLAYDTYATQECSRFPAYIDRYVAPRSTAKCLSRDARRSIREFGSGLLKRRRTDSFFVSIHRVLSGFHTAVANGEDPPFSGRAGVEVLKMCLEATRKVQAEPQPRYAPEPPPKRSGETLVLGATGFIGKRLVHKLKEHGHDIRILVRRPHCLPPELRDPSIRVLQGDVNDVDSLREAMDGIRIVYDLTVQPGENIDDYRKTTVAAARKVGEACLDEGVEKLFFTSTTAALYLGDAGTITESTSTDPKPNGRQAYARAKMECEELLLRLHADKGLDVTIFRPAIVIGRGGTPNHSGAALWNSPTRGVGWGVGNNPLPFVLVDDVAEALALAAQKPDLPFRTSNLVGDVRLTAREYVEELARIWKRPFHYHPLPCWRAYFNELVIWAAKLVGRKRGNSFPSLRDLKTRGMLAAFDTSATKRALDWEPAAERGEFLRQGMEEAIRAQDPRFSPEPMSVPSGAQQVSGAQAEPSPC